jgi:hypothetical protein
MNSMQHLHAIPEAEMVATFLRTEIASLRSGPTILAILQRDGQDRSIVDEPDITDAADNKYRGRVLGEYHGYGRDEDLFRHVPRQVRWYRALATKSDLTQVRYIDYDYWTELSGGTRLAVDAAERIREGHPESTWVFGVSNAGFWEMANALKAGASFPELILVGPDEKGPLVLLEGHMRLTAYFLVPECIPPLLSVIVGYAPGLDRK